MKYKDDGDIMIMKDIIENLKELNYIKDAKIFDKIPYYFFPKKEYNHYVYGTHSLTKFIECFKFINKYLREGLTIEEILCILKDKLELIIKNLFVYCGLESDYYAIDFDIEYLTERYRFDLWDTEKHISKKILRYIESMYLYHSDLSDIEKQNLKIKIDEKMKDLRKIKRRNNGKKKICRN